MAGAQEFPPVVSDAFNRADIPLYSTGAYVQEVNGGPVLVSLNAAAPLNPASTMKLVTSNAALELLSPAFTWKTQAFAEGRQRGDVLHGNLIIKGSGDPKLVLENFWLFLRRVRASGIREIRGNVLLDRSAFGNIPYDPALFDGDPIKPYNAGPDALLLNYKTISFHFVPDEAARKVRVLTEPPVADFELVAPRLARKGECGDWRARLIPVVDAKGARFFGEFPATCGEKIWNVHPYQMTNPQYFGKVFRRMWMELGGRFRGEVTDGPVPPAARLVAEWESAPLAEIVRDINKYSNNVMARQLLLTLANNVSHVPATPERGAEVIRLWLARKGIDAPDLSIENGSGLSRNERISALTMGRMLVSAFRASVMPEFISSLPLAGLDGTMRQRLRMQPIAGNAHIKTGFLNEVRAIAGYVLAASGKRYAVVCLVNHPNAVNGKEAQDALLQWVYENG